MANVITAYNPTFYAQEALIILENALGMARRVHRGYDQERKSFKKGDTIQIRQPGTFSSTVGGTSTASDVTPKYITLTVDNWRQVRFGLTDKELAYTTGQIINEHISPAVYRLAHDIETSLTDLYGKVPWSYDISSNTNPSAADIIDCRKVLRDNAGAIMETADLHFGIDSWLEAKFLNMGIFHQAQIAGQQTAQQETVMRGHLGTRFGVEHFVQQTLATHTSGTAQASDTLGALTADVAIGATSIGFDAIGSTAHTLTAGDSLVIAGNTQRYSITADATATGGAFTAVQIWPKAVVAYSDNDVVTLETAGTTNFSDAYNSSIMFHQNAFAFATAPLPEIGDGAGANMATVTDPRTGLSIRSRIGYDDKLATVNITLDVLYGVQALDPNLAVVFRRNV